MTGRRDTDRPGTVGDRAGTPAVRDRDRIRTVGLIVGLCLLSASAAAYEIAPASVTPLVRSSLGIGAASAGWLVSVMYAVAVVTSVPAGIALDRVGVTRAVVVAAVTLVVAGVWGFAAAVAGEYWWLVASRVVGGLSYVVLWNAGANLVGGAVGSEHRATAVGLFTASAPFGFVLGQFGGPRVAAVAGWPAVLPTFSAIAGVGVVVFLIATRGQSLPVASETPDREALVSVFVDRAVWTLCLLGFISFALYLFLNSWLPSYLHEELGVSLATSGLLTALFPAVGIVSRTGAGVLSDRLFDGRRRPVTVLAFVVAAPGVLGIVATRRVGFVVGLVVVAGFGVQLCIGLLFSYIAEVVPDDVRTTAVSLLTAVGLTGAFVAPVAAGALIERVGYRPAFVVGGLVGLVGVALAWRAPEPSAPRRSD